MKYRTMDGLRPPGFEPGSKANSNPFRKPFPKRFLGSFYATATLQSHNLFMVNFSYSITVPSKTEHIRAAARRNRLSRPAHLATLPPPQWKIIWLTLFALHRRHYSKPIKYLG